MMQTRKRSFEGYLPSPPETDLADVSSIEPSMLHILTPESYASCAPSPPLSECSPPSKKQRTRRNAKTEEEKAARAEERAVRNRRAAQESRDRRKRQYEILESENTQLREENELLKQKLDILEGRITTVEGSVEMEGKTIGKAEVGTVSCDFTSTSSIIPEIPPFDVANLLSAYNIPEYPYTQEELDELFKDLAEEVKFEEFMQYPDQATSDLTFTDDGTGETCV